MKKILSLSLLGGLIAVFWFFGSWNSAAAYTIEGLVNVPTMGDFALGPGKTEVFLAPGEKITKIINVTNRTGSTRTFEINIEDFKGSRDPGQTFILLGNEKGPYSLKDYLKPDVTKFFLEHGQRINIPVEIFIPFDAEPGGRYGSVLVANIPSAKTGEGGVEGAKGGVSIISRLGTLFFVRVKGDVAEDGFLKSFSIAANKKFFEKGPIPFEITFENNGSVHLTPSGTIEIKNLLGKKVGEVLIESYFSMPDSVRIKQADWGKTTLFGRYTASLSLNRGYDDMVDQKLIDFWVLPWKLVLVLLIVLALIIWAFRWTAVHLEIRRRR